MLIPVQVRRAVSRQLGWLHAHTCTGKATSEQTASLLVEWLTVIRTCMQFSVLSQALVFFPPRSLNG